MSKVIYTSRTPVQAYQRCKRLRWLSNYEGPDEMGLEPARKSSHLVVGRAVHVGMAVLLQAGQETLDEWSDERKRDADIPASLNMQLDAMFVTSALWEGSRGVTVARSIEDSAVAVALTEFNQEFAGGVEMDPEEARQRAAAGAQGQTEVVNDFADLITNPIGRGGPGSGASSLQTESPIVVEFGDLGTGGFGSTTPLEAVAALGSPVGPAYQPFDQDQWLREELAALVEGMVRCWARRRWRGVLEQFEVLEVEQEGEWKLGEVAQTRQEWRCAHCGCSPEQHGIEGYHCVYEPQLVDVDGKPAELHFLSRHDALLLERATGYLYLQSFKTTGSWDRRKELDAQVDMQGLSEAVDVERRFGEAWERLHDVRGIVRAVYPKPCGLVVEGEYCLFSDDTETKLIGKGATMPLAWENAVVGMPAPDVSDLVSDRVRDWLCQLPDPPTILGVRYEYLLKGSRKENKKAQPGEPRWNQESVLVRAYKQEGITSEDRRWAWSYDWVDEGGKGRRLDYRSWQKAAVWKSMPVAEWIDLLDEGKVQEGALGENGEPLDALAAQLVPVLVQYRNRDESYDWLESTEAQEVQIAKDVEAVKQAEREGGYAAKRSALNRLFGQTRTACSYPGICAYRSTPTQPGFCFGPPDAEHDPAVLEHYRSRQPNHPKESLVQIQESSS